jgi:hypothetical protein
MEHTKCWMNEKLCIQTCKSPTFTYWPPSTSLFYAYYFTTLLNISSTLLYCDHAHQSQFHFNTEAESFSSSNSKITGQQNIRNIREEKRFQSRLSFSALFSSCKLSSSCIRDVNKKIYDYEERIEWVQSRRVVDYMKWEVHLSQIELEIMLWEWISSLQMIWMRMKSKKMLRWWWWWRADE